MALATYVEENLNGDPVLVAYCLMYMFKGKFDFKSIYKEVCLWRSVLGATNTGGQASNWICIMVEGAVVYDRVCLWFAGVELLGQC